MLPLWMLAPTQVVGSVYRLSLMPSSTRSSEISWALDYPEPELKKAVKEELKYKRDWHQDRLNRINGWLDRLDWRKGGAR